MGLRGKMISSRRGARGKFVTIKFNGRAFRDANMFEAVAADLWAARRACVSKIGAAASQSEASTAGQSLRECLPLSRRVTGTLRRFPASQRSGFFQLRISYRTSAR
jgi:hypothetical protein